MNRLANLGGCAVVAAFGGLVWATLIAWTWVSPTLPEAAQASVFRLGVVGLLVMGGVTVALALRAPVGK